MERRLRKTWRGGVVLAFVIASLAVLVPPASAVHDAEVIELDVPAGSTVGDANLVDNTVDGKDWGPMFDIVSGDVHFDSDGNVVTNASALPAGTVDVSFVRDFIIGAQGPDNTYFEPSSKDDQNIESGGGASVWGCVTAANPTDKNEILNTYAVAARVQDDGAGGIPADDNGDLVLYVGGERFDNDGTAFMGIWFFQNDVNCPTDSDFNGDKTDKDILLLVNFSSGGDDITIDSFVWHPCDAPKLNGSPSPISAAKCKNPDVNAGYFEPGAGGGDCADSLASDKVCAVVNQSNVTTPWQTQDKDNPAKTLVESELFEVGFNVTDTFGQQVAGNGVPGTEPCISSFMLETRSSDSLDATLKDFARGDFDTCVTPTALKYHDRNADGNRDSGEEGLQGWTLFIDKNGNGVKNTGEPSGVTDSTGLATFPAVQSGTVTMCEELLSATPRWYNSDPALETPTNTGSLAATARCKTNITPTDDGQPDAIFGNYRTASKSGRKFEDLNGNGTDNSEPGLVVEIHLFGTDNLTNTVHRHTNTSSSGAYSFVDIVPGSYTVCETPLSNYTQTFPTSGPDCSTHADNADSTGAGGGTGYSITLSSGDADTGNDFGNAPQHRIIVLVCHENSGGDTLAASTVSIDGAGNQNSIHDVPAGLLAKNVTENELCDLGGASRGNKSHGSHSASVNIDPTQSNSGH